MEYHVYVLECVAKTGRISVHVGIAKDVSQRLGDHKSGKVKATRGRGIRCLGYSQPMPHGEALMLEAKLKKQTPQQKRTWASLQLYCKLVKHIWGESS